MARERGNWLGRIFQASQEGIKDAINKVFGPTSPLPENEPPGTPQPPRDAGIDYDAEEIATLRHIDSFQLDKLPDRIDRHGNPHKAEYNRQRVLERLKEEPYGNLKTIQRMSRDEFRGWARATGFFYH
jgi:hypothetical protein